MSSIRDSKRVAGPAAACSTLAFLVAFGTGCGALPKQYCIADCTESETGEAGSEGPWIDDGSTTGVGTTGNADAATTTSTTTTAATATVTTASEATTTSPDMTAEAGDMDGSGETSSGDFDEFEIIGEIDPRCNNGLGDQGEVCFSTAGILPIELPEVTAAVDAGSHIAVADVIPGRNFEPCTGEELVFTRPGNERPGVTHICIDQAADGSWHTRLGSWQIPEFEPEGLITVADISSDGDLDLVGAGDGHFWAIFLDGDGEISQPPGQPHFARLAVPGLEPENLRGPVGHGLEYDLPYTDLHAVLKFQGELQIFSGYSQGLERRIDPPEGIDTPKILNTFENGSEVRLADFSWIDRGPDLVAWTPGGRSLVIGTQLRESPTYYEISLAHSDLGHDDVTIQTAMVTDLNGDDASDILVALSTPRGTSLLSLLPGDNEQLFDPNLIERGWVEYGDSEIEAFYRVEINGDRSPDLVAKTHGGHQLTLFVATPSGGFLPSTTAIRSSNRFVEVVGARIDGGKPSLIVVPQDPDTGNILPARILKQTE